MTVFVLRTETFQQIILVDSEGGFCDDCSDKSDNFKYLEAHGGKKHGTFFNLVCF